MRRRPSRSGRLGIRKVNVPNLSGLTRPQAKAALEALGLSWSESATNIENINLDQSVVSQGTASGTTIKIGDSVSFSYYLYVAPAAPPSAPPASPPASPPSGPPSGPSVPVCGECVGYVVMQPTCNSEDSYEGYYSAYARTCYDQYGTYSQSTAGCPSGGQFQYYGNLIQANVTSCGGSGSTPPPASPPAAPPASPPTGCTPFSEVPGSTGPCLYNPFFGGGSQSVRYYNSDCTTYEDYKFCYDYTPPSAPPASPPASPPATPPADPPAAPPASPPATPPADPPIFTKSVSVSTLVRTPSGLVRAENLNVGDVLLSADLEGFPYNTGEGVTEAALAWTTDNPNLNIVNTTIVEIKRRTATKAVVINGDIFSQWHWILVKRNGITQFVRSEEVIEYTDYIFDAVGDVWEIVDLFEVIDVSHETISINCEPYDMFFTEKMLTHDSFPI